MHCIYHNIVISSSSNFQTLVVKFKVLNNFLHDIHVFGENLILFIRHDNK